MSWLRETNPHFRPPPNQDQQSLLPTPAPGVATTPWHQDHPNQPQSEDQHPQLPRPQTQDQHSQRPRGPRFTQPPPQPQAHGQGLHTQPPTGPWFTQSPQTVIPPVPRAKKPKRQDQQYPRSPQAVIPPLLHQDPHHQDQRRQPDGAHSDPQATETKHHGQQDQPHSRETGIPPMHQEPQQQQRRQSHGLRAPPPRSTKFLTWFLVVFCAIFWVVIILGGLIVLIIYLLFRPHSPRFDVSSVTLNAAYEDAGALLNADLTVLANFTNPNKKVRVDFSYVVLDLYYGNTLIASQYVEPFSAARRTSWFTYVHMVTSQVRIPVAEAKRLRKEMDSNAVMFQVKGVFRARSNLGSFLRYSYWLYSRCTIVLSDPPTGVIRAVKCNTKR